MPHRFLLKPPYISSFTFSSNWTDAKSYRVWPIWRKVLLASILIDPFGLQVGGHESVQAKLTQFWPRNLHPKWNLLWSKRGLSERAPREKSVLVGRVTTKWNLLSLLCLKYCVNKHINIVIILLFNYKIKLLIKLTFQVTSI